MEFIKIDDPRLDESYSFLFIFRKGDHIKTKIDPRLRGQITDGVFVGHLPAFVAASGDAYRKGRTLYEIKVSEKDFFVVADSEIEKQ